MATLSILTINVGSSNLKACLFAPHGARQDFKFTYIENGETQSLESALSQLKSSLQDIKLDAIGHRFVHGGESNDPAKLINNTERARLDSIIHLAPLHMPKSLQAVDFCADAFGVPQVACFDTAFHATLSEVAYRLPIPQHLNIRRYGFHGLNYAHIAKVLPQHIGDIAKGHIILAHLGSGASLCMLQNLKSADTTMGYTPAGGIPMATRSGDLDPGVMLRLAKQLTYEELSQMTYEKMGLLALSDGISADIATLEKIKTKSAKFAVEYFSRQVRAEIGALAAKFGQVDALVFTGGIGEHSPLIRSLICKELRLLNFEIASTENAINATQISSPTSKPILIIPADEESEIAALSSNLIAN